MCGIAVLLGRAEPRLARASLQAMVSAQAHRGPDDEGYLVYNVEENRLYGRGTEAGVSDNSPAADVQRSTGGRTMRSVALGHRRLSIIDLSPAAHQPMRLAQGKMFIIFNGEVYNFAEVRV